VTALADTNVTALADTSVTALADTNVTALADTNVTALADTSATLVERCATALRRAKKMFGHCAGRRTPQPGERRAGRR
jgi:hypothetical protein